jgi:hypothetical protein
MAMTMAWIGVKRLLERQMAKKRRTPLEYIVLATLGCLATATFKYPNRAFMTKARKNIGYEIPGYALLGNLPDLVRYREEPLKMLHDVFAKHGDVVYVAVDVVLLHFLVAPDHLHTLTVRPYSHTGPLHSPSLVEPSLSIVQSTWSISSRVNNITRPIRLQWPQPMNCY